MTNDSSIKCHTITVAAEKTRFWFIQCQHNIPFHFPNLIWHEIGWFVEAINIVQNKSKILKIISSAWISYDTSAERTIVITCYNLFIDLMVELLVISMEYAIPMYEKRFNNVIQTKSLFLIFFNENHHTLPIFGVILLKVIY